MFKEMNEKELIETNGGFGWAVVALVCICMLGIASCSKGCADADHGK